MSKKIPETSIYQAICVIGKTLHDIGHAEVNVTVEQARQACEENLNKQGLIDWSVDVRFEATGPGTLVPLGTLIRRPNFKW